MSNETRFAQHHQADHLNNTPIDAEGDLESLRQAALIPLFRDRGASTIDPPSEAASGQIQQDEPSRVMDHLLRNTYSQMVASIPGRAIGFAAQTMGAPVFYFQAAKIAGQLALELFRAFRQSPGWVGVLLNSMNALEAALASTAMAALSTPTAQVLLPYIAEFMLGHLPATIAESVAMIGCGALSGISMMPGLGSAGFIFLLALLAAYCYRHRQLPPPESLLGKIITRVPNFSAAASSVLSTLSLLAPPRVGLQNLLSGDSVIGESSTDSDNLQASENPSASLPYPTPGERVNPVSLPVPPRNISEPTIRLGSHAISQDVTTWTSLNIAEGEAEREITRFSHSNNATQHSHESWNETAAQGKERLGRLTQPGTSPRENPLLGASAKPPHNSVVGPDVTTTFHQLIDEEQPFRGVYVELANFDLSIEQLARPESDVKTSRATLPWLARYTIFVSDPAGEAVTEVQRYTDVLNAEQYQKLALTLNAPVQDVAAISVLTDGSDNLPGLRAALNTLASHGDTQRSSFGNKISIVDIGEKKHISSAGSTHPDKIPTDNIYNNAITSVKLLASAATGIINKNLSVILTFLTLIDNAMTKPAPQDDSYKEENDDFSAELIASDENTLNPDSAIDILFKYEKYSQATVKILREIAYQETTKHLNIATVNSSEFLIDVDKKIYNEIVAQRGRENHTIVNELIDASEHLHSMLSKDDSVYTLAYLSSLSGTMSIRPHRYGIRQTAIIKKSIENLDMHRITNAIKEYERNYNNPNHVYKKENLDLIKKIETIYSSNLNEVQIQNMMTYYDSAINRVIYDTGIYYGSDKKSKITKHLEYILIYRNMLEQLDNGIKIKKPQYLRQRYDISDKNEILYNETKAQNAFKAEIDDSSPLFTREHTYARGAEIHKEEYNKFDPARPVIVSLEEEKVRLEKEITTKYEHAEYAIQSEMDEKTIVQRINSVISYQFALYCVEKDIEIQKEFDVNREKTKSVELEAIPDGFYQLKAAKAYAVQRILGTESNEKLTYLDDKIVEFDHYPKDGDKYFELNIAVANILQQHNNKKENLFYRDALKYYKSFKEGLIEEQKRVSEYHSLYDMKNSTVFTDSDAGIAENLITNSVSNAYLASNASGADIVKTVFFPLSILIGKLNTSGNHGEGLIKYYKQFSDYLENDIDKEKDAMADEVLDNANIDTNMIYKRATFHSSYKVEIHNHRFQPVAFAPHMFDKPIGSVSFFSTSDGVNYIFSTIHGQNIIKRDIREVNGKRMHGFYKNLLWQANGALSITEMDDLIGYLWNGKPPFKKATRGEESGKYLHDEYLIKTYDISEKSISVKNLVMSLIKLSLQENLKIIKESKRVKKWWEHLCSMIPFFDVIQRSMVDEGYNFELEDVILDAIELGFTILSFGISAAVTIPATSLKVLNRVYKTAKASGITGKAMRNIMRKAITKELLKFTGNIAKSAAKHVESLVLPLSPSDIVSKKLKTISLPKKLILEPNSPINQNKIFNAADYHGIEKKLIPQDLRGKTLKNTLNPNLSQWDGGRMISQKIDQNNAVGRSIINFEEDFIKDTIMVRSNGAHNQQGGFVSLGQRHAIHLQDSDLINAYKALSESTKDTIDMFKKIEGKISSSRQDVVDFLKNDLQISDASAKKLLKDFEDKLTPTSGIVQYTDDVNLENVWLADTENYAGLSHPGDPMKRIAIGYSSLFEPRNKRVFAHEASHYGANTDDILYHAPIDPIKKYSDIRGNIYDSITKRPFPEDMGKHLKILTDSDSQLENLNKIEKNLVSSVITNANGKKTLDAKQFDIEMDDLLTKRNDKSLAWEQRIDADKKLQSVKQTVADVFLSDEKNLIYLFDKNADSFALLSQAMMHRFFPGHKTIE
ncbi:hypothetical protein [Pantoea sp. A4]|uniref:hypothetical protein n=1 Tax=Pantoea sp. A4 TaxID=1225184 RepID=UPI0003615467|nr:hypothetical protein [Pantoea sp. A4]